MKKGFKKPLKYLFLGTGNLTKTSLAQKLSLSYFESDSLEDPFDLKTWDLSKEIIILGGKFYKFRSKLLPQLLKRLGDYQVIIVEFRLGN